MHGSFLTKTIQGSLTSGEAVHSERQSGKSEALLREIHDKHHGRVILVSFNCKAVEDLYHRFRVMYPEDGGTIVAVPDNLMDVVCGRSLPIYVDEWWMIPERTRRELRDLAKSGRTVIAVGTVPTVFNLPM